MYWGRWPFWKDWGPAEKRREPAQAALTDDEENIRLDHQEDLSPLDRETNGPTKGKQQQHLLEDSAHSETEENVTSSVIAGEG
jgi:hypothetical protein